MSRCDDGASLQGVGIEIEVSRLGSWGEGEKDWHRDEVQGGLVKANNGEHHG
jgi:hypothetical protein